VRQIVKIDESGVLVSGTRGSFKENQPVILKPYDKVSEEMRGFYWIMIRHLADMTGVSRPIIHDCIRWQCGLVKVSHNPVTGEYVEQLISTSDSSMNNDEFWIFFTDAWRLLTQVGLQIGPETIIEPEHLHLDVVDEKRKRIKDYVNELRKQNQKSDRNAAKNSLW